MQPFDNVLGQKGFLEQSIANSSSSLIAQRGIHGLCFGLKRMNDDEDDDDEWMNVRMDGWMYGWLH